jgi:hypothetical protein
MKRLRPWPAAGMRSKIRPGIFTLTTVVRFVIPQSNTTPPPGRQFHPHLSQDWPSSRRRVALAKDPARKSSMPPFLPITGNVSSSQHLK